MIYSYASYCCIFGTVVQGLRRILVAKSQGQELRDFRRYVRFAAKHQAAEKESRIDGEYTRWPGWKFNRGTLIRRHLLPG